MSQLLPVVFSINSKYVKQLETTIVSILSNSTSNFQFYILHNNCLTYHLDNLVNYLNIHYPLSSLTLVDVHAQDHKNLDKCLSKRSGYDYITSETYFRFYIPDLFKDHKVILYLDADLIVLDDLAKLFDIDLRDSYFGVVRDPWINRLRSNSSIKSSTHPSLTMDMYCNQVLGIGNQQYFNAGVMLFNIEALRKDRIADKLWAFLQEGIVFDFQDQDVLNAVCAKNVTFVQDKWNVIDENASLPEISIKHFVGANKPWNSNKLYNVLWDKYWQYFMQCPSFDSNDLNYYNYLLERNCYRSFKSLFNLRLGSITFIHCYQKDFRLFFKVGNFCLFHKTICK